MQITVTIPDEVAARVQARGLTPEGYVETLIADAVRTMPEATAQPRRSRDLKAFFRDMAANSAVVPQLPDEAFTRESFYQDHD